MQAWAVLLDVPRVAPCLPGATVEPGGGEDGEYQGAMKIKIGPITAQLQGHGQDPGGRRGQPQGRDARPGQGRARPGHGRGDDHLHDGGGRRRHEGPRRHRHARHRPGRPVRPRRDAGRLRQADEALRRLPGRADAAAAAPEAERRGAPSPRPRPPTPEAAETSRPASPARRPASRPPRPSRRSRAPRPATSTANAGAAAAPTDDVLDLGEASRDAVLKRALPVVGGVVALLILMRIIRR